MKKLLVPFLLLVFIACHAQTKKQQQQHDTTGRARQKESLIMMNKKLLNNESAEIDSYIAKNNMKMERSGTGLRYSIEKGKSSRKVEEGDKATVSYTLSDLKGKEIYSFPVSQPTTFLIGKSDMIKGIEEAVFKMATGDKATLVIPSHLGFGKNGDGKKVPPSTILFCKLELIKLEK